MQTITDFPFPVSEEPDLGIVLVVFRKWWKFAGDVISG